MQVLNTRAAVLRRGLSLLAAVLLLAGGAARAHSLPHTGQVAPALRLPSLDGRPLDLAALRGKVVIVNFWATWCTPCRTEMPVLSAYYHAHRAQGLALLGISIDEQSDRAVVERVMRPLSYPAGLMSLSQANGFGAPVAVPFTYVIDADGVIRAILPPGRQELTQPWLEQVVGPLLRHAGR
jgi:thiol-disulfide isomerase/thioredoxin